MYKMMSCRIHMIHAGQSCIDCTMVCKPCKEIDLAVMEENRLKRIELDIKVCKNIDAYNDNSFKSFTSLRRDFKNLEKEFLSFAVVTTIWALVVAGSIIYLKLR